MVITKKIVANKIIDYLNQKILLSQLVDWSEKILIDEKYEDDDFELLNEVISRLAVADVKAFELTHEDLENYLRKLDISGSLKTKKYSLTIPYSKSVKK